MRYLAVFIINLWTVLAVAQSLPVPVLAPQPIVLGSVPRVNWANPITQGSAFGWVTIGGLQYDLVNSTYGTYSTSGPSSGYYGAVTTLAGSHGPAIPEGHAVISTSSPSNGLGDFAMMVLANPVATASGSRGMSQSINNTSFVTPETDINFNSSYDGTVISGTFSLSTYDGTGATCAGGGPDGVTSNASVIDGNWHLYGGQRVGAGTMSVKLDGVDVTSTTASAQCDVRQNYVGVGVYGDGSQEAATASFAMAWAWNRGLSANEWVSLGRNPLQLISYPVQDQLANLAVLAHPATRGSFIFRPF